MSLVYSALSVTRLKLPSMKNSENTILSSINPATFETITAIGIKRTIVHKVLLFWKCLVFAIVLVKNTVIVKNAN